MRASLPASILLIVLMHYGNRAEAIQPLVTDDIGTQGTRNQQVEFTTNSTRTIGKSLHSIEATYTVGASPAVDVSLALPIQLTSPTGAKDGAVGVKWRFAKAGDNGMAIRLDLLLPTGKEERQLGNGSTGTALTWIGSLALSSWTFHANLGAAHQRYGRAVDRAQNRQLVWRASAAAQRPLNEYWQLVADLGVERNLDKITGTSPAYLLVGAIYSPSKSLDIDAGWRTALNCTTCDVQTQRQFTAGLTWRF